VSRKGVKTKIKVLRGLGAIDNKGARYLITREIKADIKIILLIKPLIHQFLGNPRTILSLKGVKVGQNLEIMDKLLANLNYLLRLHRFGEMGRWRDGENK
jgi:hypothetical protein